MCEEHNFRLQKMRERIRELEEERDGLVAKLEVKSTKDPDFDLMDVSEAAQLLGLSRSALYGILKQKALPHVKIGGRIKLVRSALIEWKKQQLMQSYVPSKEKKEE